MHSGEPVKVQIHPGEQGIYFRKGADRFKATPGEVTDTSRCTRLGTISTVEHLMAAFAGFEITDAEVEIDADELPGLDGSSLEYVSALRLVGLAEIGQDEIPPLFKRITVPEDDAKINIALGNGHWRYEFVIQARFPGEQIFESSQIQKDFAEQVAPARTFVLSEEMPMVIQYGLGKGLDATSAVIVGPEGYDNSVRFPDELARHKMLDLIGDLYLTGIPISSLSVVAHKSGHRLNIEAAKRLQQMVFGATA